MRMTVYGIACLSFNYDYNDEVINIVWDYGSRQQYTSLSKMHFSETK